MVHLPRSPPAFTSHSSYQKYLNYVHGAGLPIKHSHVTISGKKHKVCRHCGSCHHCTETHKKHDPVSAYTSRSKGQRGSINLGSALKSRGIKINMPKLNL